MSLPNLDLSDAARTETSTDRSGFIPDTLPMGVVRASSVDDVVETLRYAHAQGIPVVTRGAGSGLAGGSSAHEGELVLDVSGMNRILSLDPQEQIIVVEPGILNAEVDDAARLHGLFYAPDPASMTYCSIGGNIATNAGGMRCAKYGVTKDSVLGLKVVLADGSILTTGGQTMKRVSGYDLTSLFIGSEGTLGVVVEATLRLRPRSETTGMFVAYFANMVAAASAAAAVTSSGIQPPGKFMLMIAAHSKLANELISRWSTQTRGTLSQPRGTQLRCTRRTSTVLARSKRKSLANRVDAE